MLLPELHRLALRFHRHWWQLAPRGNESRGARGRLAMGAMKSQRLLRRAHRTRRHRHRRAENPLSGRWSGLVGEIVSLGILVRTSRPTSLHHTRGLLQGVIVHRDASANLQLLLLTGRLSHTTKLLRHIRTSSVIQRRYSRDLKRRFCGPSYLPPCARRRSRARRRPRYRAPIVLAICVFLVITGSSGTRVLSLRLFPCPTHVLELCFTPTNHPSSSQVQNEDIKAHTRQGPEERDVLSNNKKFKDKKTSAMRSRWEKVVRVERERNEQESFGIGEDCEREGV